LKPAPRLGIYVHHHGGGHAARAGAISKALEERGAEVTLLSSLPLADVERDEGDPERTSPQFVSEGSPSSLVTLPLDTDLGDDPGETPRELHFAPLGSVGLAERMARIARWIAEWRPDLLLVDVSVEVAMLARLCGVPFCYLRQTGVRDDPPHRLAYEWAKGLLAPYDSRHEDPDTPDWMRAKTGHVGAVTRFDGERRPSAAWRPRRALVLGEGGEELAREIGDAAGGWEVLGPRPVDLELLSRTAVVVAPGGANTVAEAAFANCGLVCIPRPRPFDEQVARGQLLTREEAAVVLERSPDPARWPLLLEEARARGETLARWADGEGAGRAADYLLELARAASVPDSSSQSTSPSSASSSSQPLAGHSPQRSR
jgi:hypothetical protein